MDEKWLVTGIENALTGMLSLNHGGGRVIVRSSVGKHRCEAEILAYRKIDNETLVLIFHLTGSGPSSLSAINNAYIRLQTLVSNALDELNAHEDVPKTESVAATALDP